MKTTASASACSHVQFAEAKFATKSSFFVKKVFLNCILLLCALIVGSGNLWADPTTLFHETFGNNSNSARVWQDSYSVKSGVTAVYSGASYTVTNAKQSKNTMGRGSSSSALVSGQGTSGTFIVGPLNVSSYESLAVTNYFGMSAGTWNSTYSYMKLSYSIDNSTYTEVSRSGSNPTGAVSSNSNYVQASYTLPIAAQSSTLYLKFEFYCYQLDKKSNQIGQAYLDDVNLSGEETGESTFAITYDGNGSTSGSVPVDATAYTSGSTVTVLGNTGNLAKTYCTFGGWNTQNDGQGTNYAAGNTFTISTNTTLYAKWIDNRASAGLAWSATSADVTYGADNNVFPTLTNDHSVVVTYSSSNQAVATIDGSGVITLKDKTGSTEISAIFAGNEEYIPQTVTYTLNVTKAPFSVKDGVFDFVEAAQQNPIEDYGSGMTQSSSYTTTDKTWTAGNVTMVTSKVSGSGYRWWSDDGTLRFYNGSMATFSVPNGYVITKIVTTGSSFDSSSPTGLSGATWKGASNTVILSVTSTRNIKTITVTYTTVNQAITPAYAKTTYVTPYDMDFSDVDGLKAYRVSAAAGGVVTIEEVGAVPASTPLLLIGTASTTYNVPVIASADAIGDNMLVAGDGTTEFDGSTYDYLLFSDGLFYQIGEGTIATTKAYLHCTSDPTSGGTDAPGLRIVLAENQATNIENIEANEKAVKFIENGRILIKKNGIVYDALGRIVK